LSTLNQKTMRELIPLLESGEIAPIDIVRDISAAVDEDRTDPMPLNAYVSFDLEDIERRISENRTSGKLLGGVPIGVKDLINVLGTVTSCGSKILRDYISPYDATAIEFLRKNGGVPAGKLNMDEFAMGSSNESSAFGPVRNPVDRSKIPGGSSGGAACAVKADLAVAALASDTGGSIRQPASMCGVFGIKPTYGRVSRYGLVAYASSLDQIGPITKTVYDGALLLQAVSGFDPKDSTSAGEKPVRYTDFTGKTAEKMRIGIPDEYFGEGLNNDVRDRVEAGIDILKDAGARIKKISLEYTKYAIAAYYIIATAEASSNLARFDGIRYGTRIPSADLHELYLEDRSFGFGQEVKRRILLGTFALSSGYYDAYYLKAQKVRTLIREDFERAFEEVDLIATPVSPTAAWDLGTLINDPLQMYLSDVYTVPVNLAGLPAASVPCGTTPEGLPVGLQLIAPHFKEGDIFTGASIVEQVL